MNHEIVITQLRIMRFLSNVAHSHAISHIASATSSCYVSPFSNIPQYKVHKNKGVFTVESWLHELYVIILCCGAW